MFIPSRGSRLHAAVLTQYGFPRSARPARVEPASLYMSLIIFRLKERIKSIYYRTRLLNTIVVDSFSFLFDGPVLLK